MTLPIGSPASSESKVHPRTAVLVLGMHRSGTSALTRALHGLGLGLPENLLPAHADNSEGYFESADVVRLNRELLAAAGLAWHDAGSIDEAWFLSPELTEFRARAAALIEAFFAKSGTVVLKDPRFCRLLPFWRRCFADAGVDVGCAVILRDPTEVALSLQKRVLSPDTRPAGTLSIAKAHVLWLRYVLDAERHTREVPRCFVTFDALLNDWRRPLADISEALQLRYPVSVDAAAPELTHSVVPGLRRQRRRFSGASGWPAVASDVYHEFERYIEHRDTLDLRALDRLRSSLATPTSDERKRSGTIHEYSASQPETLIAMGRTGTPGARPRILYVSGCPNTRGHLYRVEHHVEALRSGGVSAEWLAVDDVGDGALEGLAFVVVFRAIWCARLERLYESCRARGIQVVFDVDDLVFDPEYMREPYFDYFRRMSPADRDEWSLQVAGWRRSLLEADCAVVSTDPLSDAAQRLGKRACVWRNGLSWKMVAESSGLGCREEKPSSNDGRIRLGYACGTPTHQRDFRQIAGQLAEILRRRPDTLLTVVGPLDLEEFPEILAQREQVEVRPLVPHSELAKEYARFDVNLAPLESSNPFCEAKSELKYFEAALVRVATIASATVPYKSAIRNGTNGFCAESDDDWRRALYALIENEVTRRELGEEAYWHALVRFGPEAQSLDGLEMFEALGLDANAARQSA